MNKIGVGAMSVVVVPFLAVLSCSLYAIAILLPLATLLELFGLVTSLMGNLGVSTPFVFNIGFWEVPRLLQLPVAIVVAVLLFLLARRLWRCLIQYLNYVKAVFA